MLQLEDLGNEILVVRNYLPVTFCEEIIRRADKKDAWYTDASDVYASPEQALLDTLGDKLSTVYLTHMYNVLNEVFKKRYLGTFGINETNINIFLIKYAMQTQQDMGLHYDEPSRMTMCVKLNKEFKGGTTYFPRQDLTVNMLDVGDAIIFPGGCPTHIHKVNALTEGTRYNMVHWLGY